MIISRKRFEEEVRKRMDDDNFKRGISDDLWKLKDEVRELKYTVDELKYRIDPNRRVPVNCECNCDANG